MILNVSKGITNVTLKQVQHDGLLSIHLYLFKMSTY